MGANQQPRFNAETEAAMKEARDIMSGKIKTKAYHSAAELSADIEAEMKAEAAKEKKKQQTKTKGMIDFQDL